MSRVTRRAAAGAPTRARAVAVARAAAVALATTVIWLLLAGSFDATEVVVAGVVGVATAWFGARLRRYVGHAHTGARRWARALPWMLAGAYRDCWRLTVLVVRVVRGTPTSGGLRWVPFDAGTDTADDVGRRILAAVGVTVQPGSYVVAFDADRRAMLIHELEPSDADPLPVELRGRS